MQHLQELKERTNALLESNPAPELKAAAESWLAGLGSPEEKALGKAYAQTLQEAIMPIDDVIAFMGSPVAAEKLGAENAAAIEAHARERKAAGDRFCDCPACTAARSVMAYADELRA